MKILAIELFRNHLIDYDTAKRNVVMPHQELGIDKLCLFATLLGLPPADQYVTFTSTLLTFQSRINYFDPQLASIEYVTSSWYALLLFVSICHT